MLAKRVDWRRMSAKGKVDEVEADEKGLGGHFEGFWSLMHTGLRIGRWDPVWGAGRQGLGVRRYESCCMNV